MRNFGATAVAVLLAAQPSAGAGAPAKEIAPLSSCIARAAAELGFNGSFFAKVGGSAVEMPFGTSDADGRVAITNLTRFSIGSAGKMFTAVAIGRLVDRGLVRFDAPIGRYLTGIAPQFAAITIAQLLNHTSGLGDYLAIENKPIIDAAVTATNLLPLALSAPPRFAPGSQRAYSNSGFVVLGAIIEKVSGLSYADFVRKEILAPLGMTNTRMDIQGGAEPMTRMSPGGMLDKPQPSPLRELRASPAGGIYSTASDISRFLSALTDGRFLSRDTMTALLQPRTVPGGAGTYGYGFNVQAGPPLRVGHGGGAPGVNSEIVLYPTSGAQLIALSNYDPPAASRMIGVLEKAMFAADPGGACTAALADPALHAPMAMRRPG